MEENVMKGKALWNAKGGRMVQECNPDGCGHAVQRPLITAGAIVGVVLLIGAIVAPLCAQSYPSKPIRLIVTYAPGGAVDAMGRVIGPKLSERLGQPVVLENRPGAAGNVGAELAAQAQHDGYTIVIVSTGHAISLGLYKKLNYDLIRDFVPISLTAQAHQVMIVNPSLPVKNLKELVEYARANPRKLNFASSGIGGPSHLACELLKSLAKIEIVHVPYKGSGPAMIGMMSNEVQMQVSSTSGVISQIQAGKVRPLAVLSTVRAPSLPDVPTAKEAGIDNYVVTTWYGILAPAGTPRDIVNRLNAEWIKAVAMPDTMEKMQKVGLEPFSSTPEQFSEFLKAEIIHWGKIIKDANIPRLD
jgi:tripartite-type tricarboxylate transporter receptor subunit TctC